MHYRLQMISWNTCCILAFGLKKKLKVMSGEGCGCCVGFSIRCQYVVILYYVLSIIIRSMSVYRRRGTAYKPLMRLQIRYDIKSMIPFC